MVYCKLKNKSEESAIYNIGTSVDDMTGEIVFYKDLREPEIIKQPEVERLRIPHIARIYGKYRDEFSKGNFKEKLAYEIG